MTAPATHHGPKTDTRHPVKPTDGRVIAFRPKLAAALGSIESALLLTQVLHWMPLAKDPDGWVYKSGEEWAAELGGTVSGRTALRRLNELVESGHLEKRRNPRSNLDRTSQYRATSKGQRVASIGQADGSKRQSVHTTRQADDTTRQDGESIRQIVETIPEKTTEKTSSSSSRAPEESSRKEEPLPPPRLDDWLEDSLKRHGHQVSPAAIQSLAMRLVGAGDREFIESYVLSTLVNLDGEATGKIIRALQKNHHIETFRKQESEQPQSKFGATRAAGSPNRLPVLNSAWAKSSAGKAFFEDIEEFPANWGGPDE